MLTRCLIARLIRQEIIARNSSAGSMGMTDTVIPPAATGAMLKTIQASDTAAPSQSSGALDSSKMAKATTVIPRTATRFGAKAAANS